jgi:hypothetical protein
LIAPDGGGLIALIANEDRSLINATGMDGMIMIEPVLDVDRGMGRTEGEEETEEKTAGLSE